MVTTEKGFVWEGGTLGITEVKHKAGEYWVYVPHGSEKITIKHDKLGILRDYVYPDAIKKATVYEMVFTTGEGKEYFEKGINKFKNKDYRDAIADFSKAIKIDSENAKAYYFRGRSKIKLNQKESGCSDFKKAGELGYEEAYDMIRKYCN